MSLSSRYYYELARNSSCRLIRAALFPLPRLFPASAIVLHRLNSGSIFHRNRLEYVRSFPMELKTNTGHKKRLDKLLVTNCISEMRNTLAKEDITLKSKKSKTKSHIIKPIEEKILESRTKRTRSIKNDTEDVGKGNNTMDMNWKCINKRATSECLNEITKTPPKDESPPGEPKLKQTRVASKQNDIEDIEDCLKLSKNIPKNKFSSMKQNTKIKIETNEIKEEAEIKSKFFIKDYPGKVPINSMFNPVDVKKEECDKNFQDHQVEPVSTWEPENWILFLENLRKMRMQQRAPVDDMGCDKCMDETASPEVVRYQALISLMLSSQTKDQVTHAAMQRLISHGLTIANILSTTDEVLGKLIYPVGFWKSKVKYIKKTTQTLKDEYNGDIPDTVEKLCKLNGVGPKMAHICMSVAWNKVTGIGVDTHVHRISNRIGWVRKPTKTPEATRESLQSWLPYDNWSEVNHLLVGFGQTVCQPIKPKCSSCLNLNICPFGMKDIKNKRSSIKIIKKAK